MKRWLFIISLVYLFNGSTSFSAETPVYPAKFELFGIEVQEAFQKQGNNIEKLNHRQQKKTILKESDEYTIINWKKINNQINNPAQYSQIKKSIARLYTMVKNTKWRKKF